MLLSLAEEMRCCVDSPLNVVIRWHVRFELLACEDGMLLRVGNLKQVPSKYCSESVLAGVVEAKVVAEIGYS
jgi:hypothetical protein